MIHKYNKPAIVIAENCHQVRETAGHSYVRLIDQKMEHQSAQVGRDTDHSRRLSHWMSKLNLVAVLLITAYQLRNCILSFISEAIRFRFNPFLNFNSFGSIKAACSIRRTSIFVPKLSVPMVNANLCVTQSYISEVPHWFSAKLVKDKCRCNLPLWKFLFKSSLLMQPKIYGGNCKFV